MKAHEKKALETLFSQKKCNRFYGLVKHFSQKNKPQWKNRDISIAHNIIHFIIREENATKKLVLSHSKKGRDISEIRMVISACIITFTPLSTTKIGEMMNKDYNTILYHYKKVFNESNADLTHKYWYYKDRIKNEILTNSQNYEQN